MSRADLAAEAAAAGPRPGEPPHRQPPPDDARDRIQRDQPQQGAAGTSPGINLWPGHLDDGWVIPQPVRLNGGSVLQLYKDGEALHAAYQAIRQAQRRICLEVYIFRSDETGRAFADLLSRKAREGLAVYVIYDSFGATGSDPAMFEQMRRAGVRLAECHPIKPWRTQFGWRPINRDHRKLLVIDDDLAGVGGLNVGGEYAGSWVVPSIKYSHAPWRDTAVGMKGPAAKSLMAAFARMWRYIHRGGRASRAELIHNLFDDDFGVLASVPTRSSVLGPFLARLMRSARKSIQLTMSYFAPPDELVAELYRAAARGVRVQLMLPGECDVHLLLLAARSFYEQLLEHGVLVYERQGAVLHAKTMCVDGYTTIVGSTNLDYRSIECNYEISVLIRSLEFGRQMGDLFENDVHYARQITLREWRHRPLADRIVQWAVHRTRYLL